MSYMLELESLISPTRTSSDAQRERRGGDRVPLSLLLTEYTGDRMHRAITTNVSPTGLFLDRVFGQGLDRLQPGREDREVQLEFTLPETDETIWALGEVCHDQVGSVGDRLASVHGTGVRFTRMARKHERLILDFVNEHRRRGLERLLERIVNRRRRERRRTDRRALAR